MLDWDSLYGEASAKAMSGGKKRFYDDRVRGLATALSGGKFSVSATVHGDREYKAGIIFDEQGGLYDYTCDCDADVASDGPCRHIIAAALAYESKFPSERARAGEKTYRSDAGVRALVESYGRARRGRKIADDSDKVKLTPIMEIGSDGRLSLRFTVGVKKQYVLKDVADFVSCMNTGAQKRYGVELAVVHLPESFDETSRALVRLVCGAYREKTEFLSDAKALNTDYRDRLRLSAGSVDEFMTLYGGQSVTCDDSRVKGGVRLIVREPDSLDVGFRISRVQGGALVECGPGAHALLYGKKYNYIVTDGKVYPVTAGYCEAVLPLVKAVEARGRLFVAEADMSQFYNSVLVRVANFAELDTHDIDLSVYEAAPLELKVYLEALPGGGIEALLDASYDGETKIDILDEDATYPFVRDYESEIAFINTLKKFFPDYPDLVLEDEKDIYNFMRDGMSELMGSADVYLSDSLKRMKVRKPPKLRVGVRLHSDLLGLELSSEEYTSEQLTEILQAYRGKRSYVRLTDGSFVDLIDPSLAALGDIAEVAERKGDELTLPAYYAPYVDSSLRGGFFTLERGDAFKALVQQLTGGEESITEVPPTLKNIMRNYQKAGFRWLKTLSRLGFGGILADDMGLGKSLQIIALLLSERKGTSIVVCPTTLVLNWVNELSKFAPELRVLAVSGSGAERKELAREVGDYDVIVTSYELLRRDTPLYAETQFEFAVIDEAQYIKNPETKNARAVKKLRARHRFALTGTPVENSLAELWSIFDFLMPGYLFTYPKFRDTLETEIVHGDEGATQRLSRLIKPFILRRLKTSVLKELPPKVETSVECALEGEQRELYAANLALIRDSVKAAGSSVNKVVVLGMLTRLRQICCEPKLVYPDYSGNSAKLEACLDLVRSATESGHKVLVFSQFTSMLEIIRARLAGEGITHYILKGDTPKVERMKLVAKFNEDATQVFLISLKAGGTGLNLVGADVVVHYDPWWNESVMSQATDRAYRIGQDKSVQVYKLTMQDSIEKQIMKLQEKKTALAGLITGAAGVGALKYEDILEILG